MADAVGEVEEVSGVVGVVLSVGGHRHGLSWKKWLVVPYTLLPLDIGSNNTK